MEDQADSPDETPNVGIDPRQSDDFLGDYQQLRAARGDARAAERQEESKDPSERDTKLPPQWQDVHRLSTKLLDEAGQDIECIVWLIEAEARINGHGGLADAFERLTKMINDHGADLHPQPEDAGDKPFDLIGSLNGMGREGTLVQPLRLISLVPGMPFGVANLWDATDGGEESEVQKLMTDAGPDAMRQHFDNVERCSAAMAACRDGLVALLGGQAPPFTKLIETVEETAGTIRNLAVITDGETAEDAQGDASAEAAETGTAGTAEAPKPAGAIQSREDAFAQLLKIANYFRKAEPHSPIADVLETLVRRGRMDFMELIEELIADPGMRQNVMTSAGIAQKPSDQGGE